MPFSLGRVVWWTLVVGFAAPGVWSADPPAPLVRRPFGVTRQGKVLEAWVAPQAADWQSPKLHVLLVGGLAGDSASVAAVQSAVEWFQQSPEAAVAREQFVISAVPVGNPEGLESGRGPANGVGGNPTRGYPPPRETAYLSPKDPEAAYLWRWIGMLAPDLVLEVRGGPANAGPHQEPASPGLRAVVAAWPAAQRSVQSDELVAQLNRGQPSDVGSVPAIQVSVVPRLLPEALAAVRQHASLGPSPARQELQRRAGRQPLEVARELSQVYGRALPDVVYIPAMALVGRVRLTELTGDAGHRAEVEQIVAPYVRGEKEAKLTSGSHLSGHLIFSELASRSTGDVREAYLRRARAAADLMFDEQGRMREAMPFHLEMSDSLFMGGPILAHVGALTGEAKYFDACLRHLRFMRQLCLRKDGIYRHSPLDETAWGRGNGFPALGLALCLEQFPATHPGRGELLGWYQEHLRAMLPHQDADGCWHQVVDHPESYRELTATCMTGFAVQRGLTRGWISGAEFQAAVDRAWRAVNLRVGPAGGLVDVCTGTGKQKSLREYYDRKAELGRDDRGGAMALLFSLEVAARK